MLVFRRNPVARWIYAAFLVVLAVWSWLDAGYDWWALASRMGLFLVLGLLLLLPFGARNQRSSRLGLFAVTAVTGLALLGSITTDPHRIEGALPEQVANAEPAMGPPGGPEDWLAYGRTSFGQRFSPVDQITAENVSSLEAAWTYQTGDVRLPEDTDETTYQATPIKVGNTLYLCTPHNWLVALDADTGAERWVYKAAIGPLAQRQHQTCRGVSYWPGEGAAPAAAQAAVPAAPDAAPAAPLRQHRPRPCCLPTPSTPKAPPSARTPSPRGPAPTGSSCRPRTRICWRSTRRRASCAATSPTTAS
ncbi:hypothetical protein ACFSYD_02695 [Paracoccus aerius]